MPVSFSALIIILLLLFNSCTRDEQPRRNSENIPNEKSIKEQFMKANSQLLQKENDEIDYYVRTHKMPFKRTSSGVRYFVYKPSEKGDSIIPKMQVTMDYTVTLLDGTVAYSSDEDGRRSFVVEQEDIESGIHKGVQYLKRGDQAMLIIPSHLAHGLLGDLKKIPPQSPIIYKVHIY
jgi:FKBP-type peptidyl-prolyl cis-trans isomerase FkpA